MLQNLQHIFSRIVVVITVITIIIPVYPGG